MYYGRSPYTPVRYTAHEIADLYAFEPLQARPSSTPRTLFVFSHVIPQKLCSPIVFLLPMQAVLKEVTDAEGQVVMFIDEIHTVVGAGATSGSMDASNLLKPMLARGELRCIGATTLNEYKQNMEKDKALERRFQQVYVKQPNVEDTVSLASVECRSPVNE